MKTKRNFLSRRTLLGTGIAGLFAGTGLRARAHAQESDDELTPVTRAIIDGSADGFQPLGKDDFTQVNSADDTWTFEGDLIKCTGRPVSVMRTKKQFTNFELVCQWMHEKPAGNSGIFVWTTPESIERLATAGKPGLPQGIEVQVLDLAYGQPNPAQFVINRMG